MRKNQSPESFLPEPELQDEELEEITLALKEAMPKHSITTRRQDDLFISISATRGDRTRHCYVYLPEYKKRGKEAYIRSRVDLLTGGRKKDETE